MNTLDSSDTVTHSDMNSQILRDEVDLSQIPSDEDGMS